MGTLKQFWELIEILFYQLFLLKGKRPYCKGQVLYLDLVAFLLSR